MAIDGQPAEPFPARDGRLILAPGTRIDVMLDATLPPASRAQIMLHDGTAPKPIATLHYSADAPVRDSAVAGRRAACPTTACPRRSRCRARSDSDLAIGAPQRMGTGSQPNGCRRSLRLRFASSAAASVVLAITNRATTPVTFHLHGHHFRLLDRLDDGWKPFWLDTLLFDAGQTQRIAFLAEHSGNWLMEAMGIDWSRRGCYAGSRWSERRLARPPRLRSSHRLWLRIHDGMRMPVRSTKSFLEFHQLPADVVVTIVERAGLLAKAWTDRRMPQSLQGKHVALIVDDSGWRNTTAFDLGVQAMGGICVQVPISLQRARSDAGSGGLPRQLVRSADRPNEDVVRAPGAGRMRESSGHQRADRFKSSMRDAWRSRLYPRQEREH